MIVNLQSVSMFLLMILVYGRFMSEYTFIVAISTTIFSISGKI